MLVASGVGLLLRSDGRPSAALDPAPIAAGTAGGDEPDFVALAGGRFSRGCEEGLDDACREDERAGGWAVEVDVAPFALARTETTVAQYARCVAAGACSPPHPHAPCKHLETCPEEDLGDLCHFGARHRFARPDLPVNCVDASQAEAFCAFVGGRLPTATEWEWAAKGGRHAVRPWGEQPPACRPPERLGHANFRSEQDGYCEWERTRATAPDGRGHYYAPVGIRPAGASPQGVHDLMGNVWEWTASDYGPGPPGPDGGPLREVRGGDAGNLPGFLRASMRYGYSAGEHLHYLGFRCARAR